MDNCPSPAVGQNTHNQNKESKVSREVKHLEDSPGFNKNMSSTSSTNRRQVRGGARSGTHERGEEAALWAEITQSLAKIRAEEKKFEADIPDGIINREIAIADQLNNGISPAIAAMDELSKYIRDGVKFSESTAAAIRQTVEKISILLALIKGNEAERGSNSREISWKIQNGLDSRKVTKVIGEGKSRRYKVEDVAPDEGNLGKHPKDFLTSASSMCPIPPDDVTLGPYEVGKRVLALYPETTTFYRAEVKAMLDDGKVRLIFDGDEDSTKEVERRFVLDHSG
ncbi:hypothetical protein DID88_009527 [Monilinia fructigena]|uniref:SGF29 C-terminal domain-containing protein n=1 Tax=Monilinia fructigena TaxID=38457 RepID=A0A395IPQ4_9HELO|nr:hypothetical protein DID88_009527 [Monilinia fructigena]